MKRRHIAVDLDGTLAQYERGTYRAGIIGAPIPPMVEAVQKALRAGDQVTIFTARAKTPAEVRAVEAWSEKYIGRKLPVTNVKSPDFSEFWDDRAKEIESNTGRFVRQIGLADALRSRK